MVRTQRSGAPTTIWAYAYQILAPQAADRLRTIETILDDEHADAQREARTWAGRVVLDQQVTRILIVSDSPEQNREVNRRLEAEVKQLEAGFLMTSPLAVVDDVAPVPSPSPADPVDTGLTRTR